MTVDPLEQTKALMRIIFAEIEKNHDRMLICLSVSYPIAAARIARTPDADYLMVNPATLLAVMDATRRGHYGIERTDLAYGVEIFDMDGTPGETPTEYLQRTVRRHEIERQITATAKAARQLDALFRKPRNA